MPGRNAAQELHELRVPEGLEHSQSYSATALEDLFELECNEWMIKRPPELAKVEPTRLASTHCCRRLGLCALMELASQPGVWCYPRRDRQGPLPTSSSYPLRRTP